MSARKGKLTWSDAILKVMTERGGVITLAEIYEHVPNSARQPKELMSTTFYADISTGWCAKTKSVG